MNPTTHKKDVNIFLLPYLKDHLFPHSGNNSYTKAYYIGYLIKELLVNLPKYNKPNRP